MQFELSEASRARRERYRAFVAEHIVPLESRPEVRDAHDNLAEDALSRVRARAKDAGLFSPQTPREHGGLGLDFVTMAACYEEMNRSIFGPVCFNAAAPDDGNMMVLAKVGTVYQRERWLKPIVEGAVRSSFAMTEPAPGAGSDPTAMQTTATRDGDRWIVRGRKWYTTGAGVAQHFIVIARTSDDPRKGLTAFLFDRDAPGWEIERRIPIMGPEEHGGHCELRFDELVIPDRDRLMEVGDGLKVTQIRLGPARLTHCMRWLGLSRRALDECAPYVEERRSFGSTLAEHEGVQWMLGQAAMDIEVGRLLTMRAAWLLDQGKRAKAEISMAKVQVSETLHRACDTAMQLLGAKGYSRDTILEWIYRYARQARLVDGASEVHKMVLARTWLSERETFFDWPRPQI